MTTEELKKEIHSLVEIIPENILQDIYQYLNSINKYPESFEDSLLIKKIIDEDHDLLERLAK